MNRRGLGATFLGLLVAAFVALPISPADAARSWPFPDDSNLPLLVDDSVPGSAAASYRLVVSADDAAVLFEAAAYTNGNRFLGGMIAVWEIGDPTHAFFTATTTLTSPTRIRVASHDADLDTDTDPQTSTGTVVFPSRQNLVRGTYEIVMLVGGEDPSDETLFRVRGGSAVSVTHSSFGRALIAGEETFSGVANATAAESNAIVDGTVSMDVARALTGVFLTPEAIGVTRGPSGTQPVLSEATFVAASAGAYEFTVLAGADPAQGGSPPAVLVGDVALA